TVFPDAADSVEPIENRHRDVDQNHIRLLPESGVDEFFAILRSSDQIKLVTQKTLQPLRKHDVIVSEYQPYALHCPTSNGTLATRIVPLCGADRISQVPCSKRSRSSILTNPKPAPCLNVSTSNPLPESATRSSRILPIRLSEIAAER